MARRKYMWVVRVTANERDRWYLGLTYSACTHGFLEQLRYAGLVRWDWDDRSSRDDLTLDIKPPWRCADTHGWATRNAARMCSFGYDATPVKIEIK